MTKKTKTISTPAGKEALTKKPTWKTVPDNKVRHVWAFFDGSNEQVVDPAFYAESGTPICAGTEAENLRCEGDDMFYVRTEILA